MRVELYCSLLGWLGKAWNERDLQFGGCEQLGNMLIKPFEVIDSRKAALGILLDGEVVRILALGQNPFVARNASLGGCHEDDLG